MKHGVGSKPVGGFTKGAEFADWAGPARLRFDRNLSGYGGVMGKTQRASLRQEA